METLTFQLIKQNIFWNAVNILSNTSHAKAKTKKEALARLLSTIKEECTVIVLDERGGVIMNRIFKKNKFIKKHFENSYKMSDTEENKILYMKRMS